MEDWSLLICSERYFGREICPEALSNVDKINLYYYRNRIESALPRSDYKVNGKDLYPFTFYGSCNKNQVEI